MPRVDEAVTVLYRDEEIASLAFALTGSVSGAETLVRASVARAVARGWWLRRGLQARVRHAMVRLACAELRAADAAPAAPDAAHAPAEAGTAHAPDVAEASAGTALASGVNPYAPPGEHVVAAADPAFAPPASPALADAPALPVAADLPDRPAPPPALADASATDAAPVTEASAESEPSAVDRVVATLPPRERVALVLRYRLELDERRIARLLRVSRDDVDAVVAAGREHLAATLGVSMHDVERVMVGQGSR
ncbi:MAG: RNA polymerase sigma factor [Demequina sp.]|uniref:RNA polymerase sigma factor n=1 Tax=Demequina sp. TaxID=2050685 RepID=UPI003A843596